jgi:UDP-N-acetyl-D-glucosamine dehydrogenase
VAGRVEGLTSRPDVPKERVKGFPRRLRNPVMTSQPLAQRDNARRIPHGEPPMGRLDEASTVLIRVPTGLNKDGSPDLDALTHACRTVVASAVAGQTVILTSTTYVGCTRELLANPLSERGLVLGSDVFVAFSPEHAVPGDRRVPNDQVPRVLGGVTASCAERAAASLGSAEGPIHVVSSTECAEFIVLYESAFRAVNIAYANEMSVAAHALGIDIIEVIDAAVTVPPGFLPFRPGPGVGGPRIPRDPRFLMSQLGSADQPLPLVEQAMTSIERRPQFVVDRVRTALAEAGRELRDARILIFGVAYKPNVADIRESPALVIMEALLEAEARVRYFDPYVPRVRLQSGRVLESVVKPADCGPDLVLLHTAHANIPLDALPANVPVLNATYHRTASLTTPI